MSRTDEETTHMAHFLVSGIAELVSGVARAHAARADRPEGLRVSVMGAGSTPEETALTALGRSPEWEALEAGPSNGSYADWRVELLEMMRAER